MFTLRTLLKTLATKVALLPSSTSLSCVEEGCDHSEGVLVTKVGGKPIQRGGRDSLRPSWLFGLSRPSSDDKNLCLLIASVHYPEDQKLLQTQPLA